MALGIMHKTGWDNRVNQALGSGETSTDPRYPNGIRLATSRDPHGYFYNYADGDEFIATVLVRRSEYESIRYHK